MPVILLAAAALACQARPPVQPQPSAAPACEIVGGTSRPHIAVAVLDTIDPAHAPVPHNVAERLVFGQLYETLVGMDCEGRVVPRLAAAWTSSEQGRVWQFRLRQGARFRDGSPVTAHAVMDSWTGRAATVAFAAVQALGESELRVELRSALPDPLLFARPALAVARPHGGSRWPLGSTALHADSTATGGIRLIARTAAGELPDTIDFTTAPAGDVRRALDREADVIVTSDAAAIEYARALPAYRVTPLSWRSTYILATRTRRESASVPPADALVALARDAVRGEVRPADAQRSAFACSPGALRTEWQPRRAIVYPRGDAVARAVAERLVALAWPPSRAPAWLTALLPPEYATGGAPAALGLERRAFADSLRSQAGLAFILPIERGSAGACATPLPDDEALLAALHASALYATPLLDAREFLIHRSDIGSIVLDGAGTIRFGRDGS